MEKRGIGSKEIVKKAIVVVICIAVALLSIFVVGKKASSPESYKKTIQSIDEKKLAVMGVTTTAAAASTALAAIPGDTTTPIANQIMNISSYLLIVVGALILEKSLLTVLGYLAFNILIPVACGVFVVSMFAKKAVLKTISIKIAILAIFIASIIPFSFKVGDLIYETNSTVVEELNEKVDGAEEDYSEDEEENWWSGFVNSVKESASNIGDKAKQLLNSFMDAIAIFVISYCVIPILVLVIGLWFIKVLFNIPIPVETIKQIQEYRKNNKEIEKKEQTQEN